MRWDLGDPSFDVTSEEVHEAREEDWYVETTWGWAVLRYAEVSALLRDRRFRQGNARWPAQNGIHSGLFSEWWQETLLSLEGDDHARIRKLMVPAFKNRVIAEMRPTFQAIANELIDAFAPRGRVEFVHEFAEPYAARIICLLLGLPQDHWPQVAGWADDLGASFSIDVGNQVPKIETALTGLAGYVEEVVADRRATPRDDLVTTLVRDRGADRPRAVGGAGVPRVRRDGDHPQPARAGAADAARSIPTSGRCSASSPSSAATRSRR